ncbi:hypothetical protein GDO81_022635 [Engystomops pustulosus]|uniref:G domain-containing protein n=1 Tax=Engystomops pustulosus TaxID=76066 RepID=A0AAV6Z429_ENGPU|nr:hypothetical protein GDO81_022635 [Engystomops pustulosus]
MDPAYLRRHIVSFSLDGGPRGNQGYTRVLLQLFGFSGHGKSSFINSCKFALDDTDRFIPYAEAGETTHGGAMTTVRKAYQLTENITIVDNRGYKTMNSFERAEIYAQLGNFIPIGEKVEWMEEYLPMMDRLEDAGLNPNYSDFIVPILVHRATYLLSDSEKKDVQTFLENCEKMTGVYPIVLVTHKESGNAKEIENLFKEMNVDVLILFVENYRKEEKQEKNRERNTDILTTIYEALADVKRCLEQKRDPRSDWVTRKKFMNDYIFQISMEKIEERMRAPDRDRDVLQLEMQVHRQQKEVNNNKCRIM